MRITTITILLLSCAVSVFSQGKKKGKTTSGFYQYEAECQGSEMNGTQLVRGFGTGFSYQDAKEQAKKNALYAVIFKGIRLGEKGCSQKPLVFNQNAEEEFQDYFYKFFSDNGTYTQFVTMEDTPNRAKIREKSGTGNDKLFGIVVTVKMMELKQELISKGIINKIVE